MELSKQVVSLELSKKLKELGVKQESLFYWNGFQTYQGPDNGPGEGIDVMFGTPDGTDRICSAFTVAELGEMLPMEIKHNNEWKKNRSVEVFCL